MIDQEILTYILGLLSVIVLVFIVYYALFPTVQYGTWSTPKVYPCTGTTSKALSYYQYSCVPNTITGFACVVPNTQGEITYKNIVIARTCNSSEVRDISYIWQSLDTETTTCHSGTRTCCKLSDNGGCFTSASYCCQSIAPEGGENRCTLINLPGQLAADETFNPLANDGYLCSSSKSITIVNSCAINLCTS